MCASKRGLLESFGLLSPNSKITGVRAWAWDASPSPARDSMSGNLQPLCRRAVFLVLHLPLPLHMLLVLHIAAVPKRRISRVLSSLSGLDKGTNNSFLQDSYRRRSGRLFRGIKISHQSMLSSNPLSFPCVAQRTRRLGKFR
jgi:hypothetical protein